MTAERLRVMQQFEAEVRVYLARMKMKDRNFYQATLARLAEVNVNTLRSAMSCNRYCEPLMETVRAYMEANPADEPQNESEV